MYRSETPMVRAVVSPDTHPMSLIDLRQSPRTSTLPSSLRLGAVHLTVANLDRSVAWYQRALGVRVDGHDSSTAQLGDGIETVVVLHEDPQAQPAGRHAGLYHYALLYPSREELARAAIRLAATQTPIQGASDHGTHEAIYLPDLDGNGIELAWDREQALWPDTFTAPSALDLGALLEAVDGEHASSFVGEGLRMGHVHLHVGDIQRALAFYRDDLGFELKGDLGTAAFVSAGGYHHHVGLNVWNGTGVEGPPPHTVGLRQWTVQLPRDTDVAELRSRIEQAGHDVNAIDDGFAVDDPWGTTIAVISAGSGS
jgi:catechol 2,3-dioxygenase